jgi:hypothetical protein
MQSPLRRRHQQASAHHMARTASITNHGEYCYSRHTGGVAYRLQGCGQKTRLQANRQPTRIFPLSCVRTPHHTQNCGCRRGYTHTVHLAGQALSGMPPADSRLLQRPPETPPAAARLAGHRRALTRTRVEGADVLSATQDAQYVMRMRRHFTPQHGKCC